ncbi:hypothetical protein EGC80_11490 [Shewanella psychromarinicola]|uniref:Uncharacterized protein n=1 Tax=Shewanella psychromarinicola TaxID=2487742 RepID=A0A3N4E1S9_9GAMM|nr:hypothetical protein EGC80_11490 [Shewanella psychromarinicola]RPA31216.1 hypothetical protein EGC77_14735 [Shewanella psychromarinicola]
MNKAVFILLFLSIFPTLLRAAEPISLSLGVSAIDFGDVYMDSDVDNVVVDFTVKAENGYDYTVKISNDDSSGALQFSRTASGGYTTGSITYIAAATGNNQAHEFYTDLDTANMSSDLSATITVLVAYNDIAE